MLPITDANGAAIAGAQVSVTADRPAGTWQASGSTLLTPGNPATFTADARGRVTFANPAVELDAPQLSVQIVSDDSSDDASSAVAVSPDADVHAFLVGAAPLNDLGTLTGGSLLAATRADGSPLFPVLANVPADQRAQAATGVVSAITQCVQAGQGVIPGPDDIKSFVLDLSGDVPTYASSTQPGGVQAPLVGADRLGSLSGWWDSVQNDADSFFHGLRHDAVQIATCTANWVKDEADDAYHWAVSLAVTIGDDIAEIGSIYNFQTSDNPFTQAAGIVANVSNIIAPFATKTLAETTSGGSEIIKLFIDYFCNIGAAGLMGAALDTWSTLAGPVRRGRARLRYINR